MAFHVFVEGAVDPSPDAVEQLAAAMAEHYGLPVADLRARLARGRFRVKGNCDRETADQYARDLGRLGARCVIEDADAAPARTSSPLLPARTSSPSLPARTSSPSLPPRTTTPQSSPAITLPPRTSAPSNPPANYQSGLAAAFSGDVNVASLGALDNAVGALTLASVDGDEAPAPAPAAAFTPPPQAAPAAAAAPSRPTPKPVDAFAPPDEGADLAVTLADEDVERAVAKKKISASIPPANAPAAAPAAAPVAAPEIAAPNSRRLAFGLGVVVALVVGFVPAQLYASSREAAIRHEVESKQHAADTQDAYDELDGFRTKKLGELHAARENAAIVAVILWAACGGGLAFAFRGR